MNSAQTLPRFLLPRLSWQGPPSLYATARSAPIFFQVAAAREDQSRSRRTTSSWKPSHSRPLHTSATSCRSNHTQKPSWSQVVAKHASSSARRTFHASAPRRRDHHFDTLKFVQRLQEDGFSEEQAVAMMKVLNDVIEERYCFLLRCPILPSLS